ncbi:MAG: signal peptidase I [Patescibacteria group bacterium]|nr:signal peptidase I [Patescibacteria group bacterium]
MSKNETFPQPTPDPVPDKGSPSPMRAAGSFIWDLVKILIIALVIIVPFRMFIAEPFVVSGYSMMPNFHDKDYLIIDRISYRFSPPQRGDVIVFKYPKDTSQFFIKRIIGLPGEKVQIKQGHVVIYNNEHPEGFVLNEPYLPSQTETLGSGNIVTLGSGEYYVLGDNRTASSDSRVWGILPKDDIVGKVWLTVFPPSRFGFFHRPNYN